MPIGGLGTEAELWNFVRGRLQGELALALGRIANLAGLDFGQGTFVFNGVAVAVQAAFNHGLGVVPGAVVVSSLFKNGVADGYVSVDPALSSATQFTALCRMFAVPPAGNYPFYWLAVV